MITLPPIQFILHGISIDDIQRIRLLSDPSFNAHYRHHPRELCDSQMRHADRSPLPPPSHLPPLDCVHELPRMCNPRGVQLDKYRRPSHGSPESQDRDGVRGTRTPLSPLGDRDIGREELKKEEDVGRWVQSTSNSRSSRSPTPTPSDSRDGDEGADSADSAAGPSHYHDRSKYQRPGFDTGYSDTPQQQQQQRDSQQRQVVQRSRWQTMLLEAGGFGAAWSEESMRKLRYVLQWLQYATNHIDEQILAIRSFTESLQQQYFDPTTQEESPTTPTNNDTSAKSGQYSGSSSARADHSRSSSESQSQAISSAHMHKLTSLRRDVVKTVREVVSVVSKYGGGAALPEPARDAMKGFILKLPKKVGDAMRIGPAPSLDTSAGISSASVVVSGGGGGSVGGIERDSVKAAASGRAGSDRRAMAARKRDRGVGGGSLSAAASPMSSRTTSPAASPRIHTRGLNSTSSASGPGVMHEEDHGASSTMSAGTAFLAAQRILALATESLDMMHGVTGVVKDSLDRADAWVERLKVVGVQRGDSGSSSSTQTGLGQSESDAASGYSGRPLSPRLSSVTDMRINLNLPPLVQYRDQNQTEAEPALLSPLSMNLNLGTSRSRRGSVGSSTEFSGPSYDYSRSGSLPSTPGYPAAYPLSASYGYVSGASSANSPYLYTMDAPSPSPEVGLGLRRMSIRGNGDEGEETNFKREELEEGTMMEVDR